MSLGLLTIRLFLTLQQLVSPTMEKRPLLKRKASWLTALTVGFVVTTTMTCAQKSKLPRVVSTSHHYAFALSYRVKSGQCTLSQVQHQLIQSEEEKCTKYKIEKTSVSYLYKSMKQSTYSVKKHSAIYQGEKICISQEPVVQCVSGSTPKAVTHKTVKFVCLPEGRVSKLYAERIERGESPQELMQQPVAFETKMAQPISCGIIQLYFFTS